MGDIYEEGVKLAAGIKDDINSAAIGQQTRDVSLWRQVASRCHTHT